MDYKIVFSDADGTLLDSTHRIQPGSLYAIRQLEKKNIPFVIVSGRHPSGIYSIQEENDISGPMIAYGGALIQDKDRNVLYSEGFSPETARQITDYLDNSSRSCTWNIFSGDLWLVKDKNDSLVREEEEIIHAPAWEGTVDSLPENALVNKILCMCPSEEICETEQELKKLYPYLSIVKSADTHLEVMPEGISKSSAVRKLCRLMNISPGQAIAFGDHFNDKEMLETAGLSFLMDNAPDELKKMIPCHTADNDSEGIYKALLKIGLIPENKEFI